MAEEKRSCFECPYDDCIVEAEEDCKYLLFGEGIASDALNTKVNRQYRQNRYDRYHNDPAFREKYLREMRERYAKRKAEKRTDKAAENN